MVTAGKPEEPSQDLHGFRPRGDGADQGPPTGLQEHRPGIAGPLSPIRGTGNWALDLNDDHQRQFGMAHRGGVGRLSESENPDTPALGTRGTNPSVCLERHETARLAIPETGLGHCIAGSSRARLRVANCALTGEEAIN